MDGWGFQFTEADLCYNSSGSQRILILSYLGCTPIFFNPILHVRDVGLWFRWELVGLAVTWQHGEFVCCSKP